MRPFLLVLLSCLAVGCADPESPPARAPDPAPASLPPPDAAVAPVVQPPAAIAPHAEPRGMPPQLRSEWPWNEHPDWKMVPLVPRGVAFATYLNAVHMRVHSSFADVYVEGTLSRAPANDPRNAPGLSVQLHVLVAPNGALAKIDIGTSSGVPAFDREALAAFARTAPFPPTPPEIRSPDGNVYVRWELRRDPIYACSTMNARPFLFERETL